MKKDQERLIECLVTIKQFNGHSHVKHITAMTKKVPGILGSISIDVGADRSPAGKTQRQLVRAIALVEATRAGAALPAGRLQTLLGLKEASLKSTLAAMVDHDAQDPDGPVYVGPGEGKKLPKAKPGSWEVKEHFACHLDTKTIVAGPINPRTHDCLGNVPAMHAVDLANNASGHCQRAWELARYFQVPGVDFVKLFAGGASAPRFVAGMVTSLNPLTFTDETGHFKMNYSKEAEAESMAILRALNRNAKFYHFNPKKCPNGPAACPGHA